jgi:hypothetical protein
MLILMLIVAVIVIVGIVLCNTFDMWNHDVLYTLGGCLWMIGGIALIIIAKDSCVPSYKTDYR